jgi:hypothetical protein
VRIKDCIWTLGLQDPSGIMENPEREEALCFPPASVWPAAWKKTRGADSCASAHLVPALP